MLELAGCVSPFVLKGRVYVNAKAGSMSHRSAQRGGGVPFLHSLLS